MPGITRARRIERYVLRELLSPLLLTLVVASLLLLSGEFLREIIDKWLNRGLNVGVAVRVLMFLMPPLLIFTLPVALLLATLIAFGRLSEDHEIVAMQASGVSWSRLFAPALTLAVLATALNAWLAGSVVPLSRHHSRQFLVQTMLGHPTLLLEPQTWLREVRGMHVWVGAIDDDAGELRDLRIYRNDKRGNTQTITATSGRIDIVPESGEIMLELRDGVMHQASETDPEAYDLLQFKKVRVPFPVYALERAAARVGGQKINEMSFGQLIRDGRTAGPAMRRRFWSELGSRTAMPFSCLSFVLVGAPLGVRPHKSPRAYGAAICITLVILFYLLSGVGDVLARNDIVHPMLGLWTPNLLLGGAGAIAVGRLWRR